MKDAADSGDLSFHVCRDGQLSDPLRVRLALLKLGDHVPSEQLGKCACSIGDTGEAKRLVKCLRHDLYVARLICAALYEPENRHRHAPYAFRRERNQSLRRRGLRDAFPAMANFAQLSVK